MKENGYTTSRTDAAKLLKISIRTLDRYVKSGRLSSRELDGRVLLNIEEIYNFGKKSAPKKSKSVYRQTAQNVYRQNDDFVYTKKPDLPAPEAVPAIKPVYRQNTQNVYRQNSDFVHTKPPEKTVEIISPESSQNYDPEIEDLKKQLLENIEFQQYKEKALLSELTIAQTKKLEFEKNLKLEKIKRSFFLLLFLLVLAFQPIWIYIVFFR